MSLPRTSNNLPIIYNSAKLFGTIRAYIIALQVNYGSRPVYDGLFSKELTAFHSARDAIIKNPALLTNDYKKKLIACLDSEYFTMEEVHTSFEKNAGPKFMAILRNFSTEKEMDPPIPEASTKNIIYSSPETAKDFIANVFKKLPDFLTPDESDTLLNINETDKNGFTQLSWAANLGCCELVYQYLEAGADPNVIDHSGNNALIRAVYGNYLNVVDLLLKNHADPNTINKAGNSALSIAVTNRFFDIALLLVDHPDLDVNIKLNQEMFLESIQRVNANHRLIVHFIQKGIDKTILGKALVQAFHDGAEDTMSLLIDAGASLEEHALQPFESLFLREEKGTVTTLAYAIAKKDLSSIAKLMLAGASLNEPHKLYTFLMNLANKENKHSFFIKSKSLPTSHHAANLYNCLSALLQKQKELRFLNDNEYKKLESVFLKMKTKHQRICQAVDQVTHFPDVILDIIDGYHHPHGHSTKNFL